MDQTLVKILWFQFLQKNFYIPSWYIPCCFWFSSLVVFYSLPPHGLQHTRLPCPSPSPRACSNSCPLSQWCNPTISLSVVPFSSCLPSFPASGSFLKSQLFSLGRQSIEVSASILPMNIQDWFPLGLTGLISLLSKGLLKVFSSTTVRKRQLFGTQPSLWSTLTSKHDYCKNHSFDYTDLCQQRDVFAF